MAVAARRLVLFAVYACAVGATLLPGELRTKYFRDDYNFHPNANGWLKLHRIPNTWLRARLICALEGGAVLASPLHEGLRSAMSAELQVLEGSTKVFTGIRTISAYNFYFSIEGVPLEKMHIQWAPGEPDNFDDKDNCIAMTASGMFADDKCEYVRPFLCYKENTGIPNINECGSTDEGYRKDENTGSCYKFHRQCMTWWGAHMTCAAEGGSLAVINSEREAQVILSLLDQNQPKDVSCHHDRFAFLGFHNWMKESNGNPLYWSTLDGKTLKNAGFERWANNEPNNVGGQEYCGSVIRAAPVAFNDVACDVPLPFICELHPL